MPGAEAQTPCYHLTVNSGHSLQVMSCTTPGGAIHTDGEPGVVQHGGPRLRFGERAMIYKVHCWPYPGCQCTLSTKSFSLYFPILYVIPWVLYLQMYPSASWEVPSPEEHSQRRDPGCCRVCFILKQRVSMHLS